MVGTDRNEGTMTTIKANVSKMFSGIEPWDVSNNRFNLGDRAAQITWQNALRIAENVDEWLLSDFNEACEGIREQAAESGYGREEVEMWANEYCIGFFVQNIASELRDHLDADNQDLVECAEKYLETDWESESWSPTGSYSRDEMDVIVDYYTGI